MGNWELGRRFKTVEFDPLSIWNIFYYFFGNCLRSDTDEKVDLGNNESPTDPIFDRYRHCTIQVWEFLTWLVGLWLTTFNDSLLMQSLKNSASLFLDHKSAFKSPIIICNGCSVALVYEGLQLKKTVSVVLVTSRELWHSSREVPRNSQSNGRAEKHNRTLLEKARCMLHDVGLPIKFWAEAISTVSYLSNRSPHSSLLADPSVKFGKMPWIKNTILKWAIIPGYQWILCQKAVNK